jgi:hypothetical protein
VSATATTRTRPGLADLAVLVAHQAGKLSALLEAAAMRCRPTSAIRSGVP